VKRKPKSPVYRVPRRTGKSVVPRNLNGVRTGVLPELKIGTTLGETKTQVSRLSRAATDWEVRRTQKFKMDYALVFCQSYKLAQHWVKRKSRSPVYRVPRRTRKSVVPRDSEWTTHWSVAAGCSGPRGRNARTRHAVGAVRRVKKGAGKRCQLSDTFPRPMSPVITTRSTRPPPRTGRRRCPRTPRPSGTRRH
jgi:hypothetical protein